MVEQTVDNRQVGGSNPSRATTFIGDNMDTGQVQTAEEILLGIRRRQAIKRKALDEINLAITNLHIPPFVSSKPKPVMINTVDTMLSNSDFNGMKVVTFIERMQEFADTLNVGLGQFTFKLSRQWDDVDISVELSIHRLEDSIECEERLTREQQAHTSKYQEDNEVLLKKYKVARKSLEKQLTSLLEVERRFLNDSDQVLRDMALAKLSEAERKILGFGV